MPYKQGKKWRGTVTYQNKRHTALFSTKKEALVWQQKLLQELKKIGTKTPIGMDFLTLSNKYLDHFTAEHDCRQTISEKRKLSRMLLKKWGNIPIQNITKEMIKTYLAEQKKTRSANAANRDRKNLGAMFEYAIDILEVKNFTNLVRSIKKYYHKEKPRGAYTEKEIAKLFVAADRFEALILRAYVETAGRMMEVFRLTWDDVNMEHQCLTLWSRKNRSGEWESENIPISETLSEEFRWHWKNREIQNSPYVFPSPKTGEAYVKPYGFLKSLWKRADVHWRGMHPVRGYVASMYNDKHKVSLKTTQKLLRHKNLTTTARYVSQIHSNLNDHVGIAVPEKPQIIPTKTKDNK